MLCARALRPWKIRPMSALRGIRHSRAMMWQRVRGVARACRNGAGYRINYNDPIQEEQEMVCLEVWMVSMDFSNRSQTLVVRRWSKHIKFFHSHCSVFQYCPKDYFYLLFRLIVCCYCNVLHVVLTAMIKFDHQQIFQAPILESASNESQWVVRRLKEDGVSWNSNGIQ